MLAQRNVAVMLIGSGAIAASASVSLAQQPAASPWVDAPQSRMRLVGGADASMPGARVILVELTLQPEWKTYWRVPGDAGIPPSFDWSRSKNLGAVDVRYPAPIVYVDRGGTTIGYKNAVTFAVVTRPTDPKAQSEVRLDLAVGICRDICIPVEMKLSLDIAPSAALPTGRLTDVMATVPVRKLPAEAAKGAPAIGAVSAELAGPSPKLVVKTSGVKDLMLEAPDGLFVPLATRAASADTFEVDLTKTQDLADLRGKTLTITATGPAGAIETPWRMPAAP